MAHVTITLANRGGASFRVDRRKPLLDVVQVFRVSDALPGIAREAIDIGAKVLWMQLGVRSDEATRLAEAAG